MTSFSIIIDSREQDKNIKECLIKRGIPFIIKKLDFGDFSFNYKGKSYEKEFVVERKNSVSEISGNFTKGSRRFKNEFYRGRKAKFIVMIEADEEDVKEHNYRSSISSKELRDRMWTWSLHYRLTIHFIKKRDATDFILNEIKQFLKKKV